LSSLDDYAELSGQHWDEFVPVPGRAFWLICSSTNSINSAPVKGLSTPTDSLFAVTLEPGWNQIGNPFVFPVAWDSIMVDTLVMGEAETVVVEPAVSYDAGGGYIYGIETLEPFQGYWVKNLSDEPVSLRIPPRQAAAGMTLVGGKASGARDLGGIGAEGWKVGINVSCDGAVDPSNHVGVLRGAADTWDRHDRSEPPMSPGRAVSLYFPHKAWDEHPGNYTCDMRQARTGGDKAWGQVWRFDIAKSFTRIGMGDEVRLEFMGLDALPAGIHAQLVDRHLGVSTDLKDEPTYVFRLAAREVVSEADARFVLLVGTEEFIEQHPGGSEHLPARSALHRNYPNPFTTSTIIRYDIARPADVALRVYDAGGALVTVLKEGHHEPGRYEYVWSGDTRAGHRAAPGIYFCRLTTESGFQATHKILLIR
jgi:hypothetical protein